MWLSCLCDLLGGGVRDLLDLDGGLCDLRALLVTWMDGGLHDLLDAIELSCSYY